VRLITCRFLTRKAEQSTTSAKSGCTIPFDAVGTNDASYSKTTLYFMQYLTSLMDSRIWDGCGGRPVKERAAGPWIPGEALSSSTP